MKAFAIALLILAGSADARPTATGSWAPIDDRSRCYWIGQYWYCDDY